MGKIETFNIRAQLAEASGSPGARDAETMQRIKRVLPSVLSYTVSVINDNPKVDNLEAIDLLTDAGCLIDEITQYYYSQIKITENENREHERSRRFEGNLL